MPSRSSGPPEALHDAVDAVAMGALRLRPLIALELDVPGPDDLSMRWGATAAEDGLASWSVPLPSSDWLSGGALNATARAADEASGRIAAEQAVIVIAHLLSSDHRRQQAEALAERALAVAGVDQLTGLGNRRSWARALAVQQERAARDGHWTSVLVLDLDGLKEINDRDGHAAGDRLLVRAADLLASSCRQGDTVCRLGGDEFGVLAPHAGERAGQDLAARLRRTFRQSQVAVSIGLLAVPAEESLDAGWQQADLRMYEEKRARL